MFVTFSFLCVCLSSLHRPSISVLLLLGNSAQQRSSQTNKSQSSAGNQVSICHVSCVKQWRSREYCTPTQRQDGYCKHLAPLSRPSRQMWTIFCKSFVNPLQHFFFSVFPPPSFSRHLFNFSLLPCFPVCC